MKLPLDECVPRRLKNDLKEHDVQTVDELGLKGVLDAEVLRAAAAQAFDVFITVDRRIPFQQNLLQFNLALMALAADPCRYPKLKLLIPSDLTALRTIKTDDVVTIQEQK